MLAWPRLLAALRPADPRRVMTRPDATVLDLGSGLADFGYLLANEHWTDTYAVDASPAMHRLGQSRFKEAWIHRTMPDRAGRLPIPDATCTAGMAHLFLQHLPHHALVTAVLTEAHRVLRPAAPLIVIEPGDHGVSFPGLRWGEPGDEAIPGASYTAHYTLTSGAVLPTTAWHHSAETLAHSLATAGFALTDIRPLPMPDGDAAPFRMWRAVRALRPPQVSDHRFRRTLTRSQATEKTNDDRP
jgi:ubiquinone/menaquinone biosynthesis C-methylase UbiE